jgi:Kinesin-associated protein (KAP)
VDEFIKAVVNHEYNDGFIIDCIAVLGNMNTPEIDYSHVLQTQNLLSWMKNTFTLEKTNDDLVLQEIMFLCTCIANDELSTMLVCKTGVVLALIDLLRAKQEDDEIVLQIIFMFQLVLKNESTRNYIISETETPAYLIDLMHDKNIEIRKVCDICLDIIAMVDKNWATRIKLEKFRNHNSQWLNMVESQEVNNSHIDENYDAEDNDLPIYLTSDYLTQIYESGGDSGSSLSNGSNIDSRPVSKSEREIDLREPKEF